MDLNTYDKYYFVGIGGIGMSALARWFRRRGCLVAGYDRTPTPLTAELEAEGIHVHYEDNLSLVDESFLRDPAHTLVCYTPAIPAEHAELTWFKNNGFQVVKRSKVLGLITAGLPSLAVAGTHGKTTTSAMAAHILHQAGVPTVAFVGGIMQNYDSNLVISGTQESGRTTAVVEADEYDRSFLQLSPLAAILTSADPDHLDIYGTGDEMLGSYRAFVQRIRPGGRLLLNEKLAATITQVPDEVTVMTYGVESGEAKAVNVRADGEGFRFSLVSEEFSLQDVHMAMPGFHNVENVVAAAMAAYTFGVEPEAIQRGIESFRGVRRRFEYALRGHSPVLIDDYAHHPEEIRAFLESVKALYPGRHITAIFQPHLFTRTRDFAEGFAKSLSMADRVILLDIYPARELPIPGINAGIIHQKLTSAEKHWTTLDNLLSLISTLDVDIVTTIGAGDISTLVQPLAKALAIHSKTPAHS